MLVPRQQYSRELRVAAMRELDSGKGIAEVARTYQLSPKRLETWKGEWRDPLSGWQSLTVARWTIIGDVGTDIQPVVPSQPQRKSLWRAIQWPLFGLCTILLIAWVSLPTLDGPHRRQFANEAVSVTKLRTINRRQALYSAAHPDQGFACQLSRLKSAERTEDPHYDPEEFLVSGTQSGYRFVVLNCQADHYEVAAVPIEPGRSGFRAFCTDDSGLLWYDKDGSAEACLALHQPLE